MKTFFSNLESKLIKTSEKFPLKYFVYRFISAFSFVSLCTYAYAQNNYTEKTFYDNLNFVYFLILTAILTALLFLIQNEKWIRIVFLISVSVYLITASVYVENHFLSLGLCLLICMTLYYTETDDLILNFNNRKILWVSVLSFALVFILHTSITTILHYVNYGTPCFDFGLFAQMFHYMKTTGLALSTCERDRLLNHFAVHFSPIYYLILPFYILFPSPITLLISQAVIVASGVIPVVLLCKHFKLSNVATLLFSLCFCFYPAFAGGVSYFLHENCFLVPFLLWLFYFMERENIPLSFLFVVLTLCIKEDAAVYVAIIALYFLLCKKKPLFSFSMFLFSIISFFIITNLMNLYGEGVMSDSRYGDYIYDNNGLFTVIKSVILNPLYALQNIFKIEKLEFILQMAVPLCFLPFCIKKPVKVVLLIPFVLIHLMTNYQYQYDINFQYIFGTGAIFFYLAISNYAELKKKNNISKSILYATLCTLLLFTSFEAERWNYVETFHHDKTKRETISTALSLIPEDASVSASTFFIANMSKRDVLYELEKTEQESDYIVLDLRSGKDVTDPAPYFTSSYEVICYEEDILAIFKKVK